MPTHLASVGSDTAEPDAFRRGPAASIGADFGAPIAASVEIVG